MGSPAFDQRNDPSFAAIYRKFSHSLAVAAMLLRKYGSALDEGAILDELLECRKYQKTENCNLRLFLRYVTAPKHEFGTN